MNKFSFKKLLSVITIAAVLMVSALGCGKKEAAPAGAKEFTFVVIDQDANETSFDIHTDKTTVGEALLEEGLIEGEDGPYGLYVQKVNGIEAIYENNGTYWAFYINDEYAMTGVDATDIEDGTTYTFKVEGN